MRLEHLAIGVAIFMIVITAGFNLYNQQISNYDIDGAASDIFTEALRNVSTDSQDESADLRDKIEGQSISAENTEAEFYKSGYPGTISMWNSQTLAGKLIMQISTNTGIMPDYVIGFAYTIIGILCTAFVIYMIWRFKPVD